MPVNTPRRSLLASRKRGKNLTYVIGFTGHQTLPRQVGEFVQSRLAELLNDYDRKTIGITSLARGADQLFARCILSGRFSLGVVIPCERYEESFSSDADRTSYHELLSQADEVEHLPFPYPSEEAYYAAGRRIVDRSDQMIAVWDGEPSRGFGGTADIVNYATSLGIGVTTIWPPGARRV